MADADAGEHWYRALAGLPGTVRHCWDDKPMAAAPSFEELVGKGKQGRGAAPFIAVVSYKQHVGAQDTKADTSAYVTNACPVLLTDFSKPVSLARQYGGGYQQACTAKMVIPRADR